MVRTFGLTCVAAGLALLPTPAQAQQAGQDPAQPRQTFQRPGEQRPGERAGQAEGQRQGRGQQLTGQLAAWLAGDNFAEVQLAQLAQKQGNDPAVKEFAKHMEQEHAQFITKLQQFMPKLDTAGAPAATTPGVEERTAAKPMPEGRIPETGRPGARGQRHPALLQIGAEATQRRVELTSELLSQKEGHDFDMGYMAQQAVAHVNMLATLQAMQDAGSPEFQKLVEQGITATKSHLEHAQKVAAKLNREEETQQ